MKVIPMILVEPKCPQHPNAKNIKVGGDGRLYTEFYCRHCKKIYVARVEFTTEKDDLIMKLSVTEKKEKEREKMVVEDEFCRIYRLAIHA